MAIFHHVHAALLLASSNLVTMKILVKLVIKLGLLLGLVVKILNRLGLGLKLEFN